MNNKDDLKLLRLQHEKKFIDSNVIDELAQTLIGELVRWANKEIFSPRDGELTFDITIGCPNAGVGVSADRPFHPRMEFRSSLISDIYADAFAFPIISRRILQETEALNAFNETKQFLDCRARFNNAVPNLHDSDVSSCFRPFCQAYVEEIKKDSSNIQRLQADDVRCRFIMFELMLVWTFFHELGHVVQGHHRMHQKRLTVIDDSVFFEVEEVTSTHSAMTMASATEGVRVKTDLAAQARELMADADATDQTLKYLVIDSRLNFRVWYLLLCSTGSMFQRFYAGYPDNLELSHAKHPHPAIRDEVSLLLGSNWTADFLVASESIQNRNEAAIELAYLSVRASLMTGLFRSMRIEKRDSSDKLPSYMELIKNSPDQQRRYIKALLPEIEQQLPMILEYHLIKMHSLEYWFNYLKNFASTVR